MGKQDRTLLFEMPFNLEPPVLVNHDLGIDRITQRGASHSFRLDLTLLDAADHRLLRSGLTLAHRVVDGLGERYLDAPSWGPWLPTDHSIAMAAEGDLPEELASLVRPFRRGAPLGPVALVTCERTEYAFKDVEGAQLGVLRDDKLTIRRSGLTTARYREATVMASGLTPVQVDFVIRGMSDAGGTRVSSFPSMVQRLGAPATGLTDFPAPREQGKNATLEEFVSALFATRLRGLMAADLALRSGRKSRLDALIAQVRGLGRELDALSFALEPTWRTQCAGLVNHVVDDVPETVHQLGEAYFDVIDTLISAVRAPKLGNLSARPAGSTIRQQVEARQAILVDRCGALSTSAPDDRWTSTLVTAEQLEVLIDVAAPVMGAKVDKLDKALLSLAKDLQAAQVGQGEPSFEALGLLTPQEAFEAGRVHQRSADARILAREEFARTWPNRKAQFAKLRVRP